MVIGPFRSALLLVRTVCHLEDNLPGMTHDLRTNLNQFLPQRRQRWAA